MNPLVVALLVFAFLLFLGMPIVFVMTVSSVSYCLVSGKIMFLMVVVEKMFRGMDSFVLLAIPMFVMCGEVMNSGSTFFAGITGSALSDIASLGSIMIPSMEKQGYDKDFSCAVTAATSIQGPLIPPSIPAVLVASATGLSTGALFWGGAVPGLMIGAGCAIVIFIQGLYRHFPKRTERIPFREAVRVILSSVLPLMTIVIIMAGISSGLFTPTEAAAVALAYALIITTFIYHPIPLREGIDICRNVLLQTTGIYMIIAGATTFSYVLAIENIPSKLSAFINSFAHSQAMVLLVINLILLVWGMFMDTAPSIMVLVPILYPVATGANIDPIHFGVLVVTNLMVGLLTPPFGMALYTVQSVGKCQMVNLIKAVFPFIIMNLVVLILISAFPQLVLTIPKALGLC